MMSVSIFSRVLFLFLVLGGVTSETSIGSLDLEPDARYIASSFGQTTANVWDDVSANSNFVQGMEGVGSITRGQFANGRQFLVGPPSTRITFPPNLGTGDPYTVFSVTAYASGSHSRILDGTGSNWLSGHWANRVGISHHGSWLATADSQFPVDDWIIGSDRRQKYHAYGYNDNTGVVSDGNEVTGGSTGPGQVTINNGAYKAGESSDFKVAEVIIFARELSDEEVDSVEDFLLGQYTAATTTTTTTTSSPVAPIAESDGQYFTSPSGLSWQDAEDFCVANGGHLVSIHSDAANFELANVCMATGQHCWIGLYQPGSDPWQWIDGSAVDYAFDNDDGYQPTTGVYPWHSGEPNGANEDCAHLWENAETWNDAPCTMTDRLALCETAEEESEEEPVRPARRRCERLEIDFFLSECSSLFPAVVEAQTGTGEEDTVLLSEIVELRNSASETDEALADMGQSLQDISDELEALKAALSGVNATDSDASAAHAPQGWQLALGGSAVAAVSAVSAEYGVQLLVAVNVLFMAVMVCLACKLHRAGQHSNYKHFYARTVAESSGVSEDKSETEMANML